MGSIASQSVLIAGGAQDGFNWKGVAMGAVGSAATAGLGALAGGSNAFARTLDGMNGTVRATTLGAATSATSQAIGSVTGLQSFSWKNVAAGAVASGANYGSNQLTSGWKSSFGGGEN